MNISYDAYRVFYYTAKYRSFTRAASILGNSQPNVTRAIKNLEQALGCTLFLRSNRRVELTAEGEILYRHVSAAFEQLLAGEEALFSGDGPGSGITRIAATELSLRIFLLPVLSEFRSRYPGVRIKLNNGSTPAAIEDLENGLVDMAFVVTPVHIPDGLRKTVLVDFQEVAVCGRAYRSLADSRCTLSDLTRYPIISLAEGSSTYGLYSDFFGQHQLPFHPDIEAAAADQILPMVRSNLGIGFVPAAFLHPAGAAQDVLLVDLAQRLPSRQICLVESVKHGINPAARELKALCRKHSQNHFKGGSDT